MKRNAGTTERNRMIMTVGWISIAISMVLSMGDGYDGRNHLLLFASAVAPWIMLGIGLACCVVSYANEKEKP